MSLFAPRERELLKASTWARDTNDFYKDIRLKTFKIVQKGTQTIRDDRKVSCFLQDKTRSLTRFLDKELSDNPLGRNREGFFFSA
jgi:hypothetical protein